MQVNPRRLYRSRDRQLAGVAGGMAEYLDIDPTVARILWILAGLLSAGLALLAYFVLALVIPQAPYATAPYATAPGAPGGWPAATGTGGGTGFASASPRAEWTTPPAAPGPNRGWNPAWNPAWTAGAASEPRVNRRPERRGFGAAAIAGVVLIVIGAVALADAAIPGWVGAAVLGPVVILALGAALLVSSIRRGADEAPVVAPAPAATQAAGAGPVPAATPWDAMDTRAVDPAVFGPASAADGGGGTGLRGA
jgi:phage shock protein C